MKPNAITLTKEGNLIAFEAPEKPKERSDYSEKYKLIAEQYVKDLQAAIDNGVEFNPESATLFKIKTLNEIGQRLEQGKHYPMPDGYEIKKEQNCPNVCDCRDEITGYIKCKSEYAILVPKQEPVKGAGDDYPIYGTKTFGREGECIGVKRELVPYTKQEPDRFITHERAQELCKPIVLDKQQTPLQKLIFICKSEQITKSDIIHSIVSLLPEEKQMVIDAYNEGESDGQNMAKYLDHYKYENGEQYFNETFQQ